MSYGNRDFNLNQYAPIDPVFETEVQIPYLNLENEKQNGKDKSDDKHKKKETLSYKETKKREIERMREECKKAPVYIPTPIVKTAEAFIKLNKENAEINFEDKKKESSRIKMEMKLKRMETYADYRKEVEVIVLDDECDGISKHQESDSRLNLNKPNEVILAGANNLKLYGTEKNKTYKKHQENRQSKTRQEFIDEENDRIFMEKKEAKKPSNKKQSSKDETENTSSEEQGKIIKLNEPSTSSLLEVRRSSTGKKTDDIDALIDSIEEQRETSKRKAHSNAARHSQADLVKRKRVSYTERMEKTWKEAEEKAEKIKLEEEANIKKKYCTQEQLYGGIRQKIGSVKKGEERQARPIGKTITVKSEPKSSPKKSSRQPPAVLEPGNIKIPRLIRVQMIQVIFKQFLENRHKSPETAAQTMELELMKNAKTKETYRVNSLNAVARLRKQCAEDVIAVSKNAVSHDMLLAGKNYSKISIGIKKQNVKTLEQMTEAEIVERIEQFKAERDILIENGYPHYEGRINGRVVIKPTIFDLKKNIWIDENDLKRICCRCHKEFSLLPDWTIKREKAICRYHNRGASIQGKKQTYSKKHLCCGEELNTSEGCKLSDVHVFEQLFVTELDKFVPTPQPIDNQDSRSYAAYAIDCEMVYTINGPAIARLSVVNLKGKLVLDVKVKPPGELLDANTEFSGLTMKEVEAAEDDLSTCHQKFFKLVNSETILIGHSLESDLKALRLVHMNVVDTALLYASGQYKKPLRKLAAEILKRFIQSDNISSDGHDSYEDAKVCIDLIMNKIKT